MKKKLLSVLLALTMMLTVLPVSALAAELTEDQKAALVAQGYSEEEIANAIFIDEDTELTEDVEGLIIVVAPVKVTVKGAKLATGLLIAPGAKGAAITLGENADVNAVIVMDTAEVTVEEKAVAASVTVTAPETKVAVAGEVKAVNVAAEAEKAAVTVAETAKVDAVEIAAPAAAVEVAGAVASVAVAETAAGASVAVAEKATVSALAVSAPDVKADVAGTVESVTVAETATGAELAVAETATVTEVTDNTGALTVSGDGAANVTVTDAAAEPSEEDKKDEEEPEEDKKDEEEPAQEEKKDENTGVTNVPFAPAQPIVEEANIGLKTAPQADHGNQNLTTLSSTYTVTTTHSSDDADNEYRVVITATDLVKHKNTNADTPAYGWVGLSIPRLSGGANTYYMLKYGEETISPKSATNVWTDDGTTYDTHYFAFTSGNHHDGDGYTYQLAVYENAPDGGTPTDFANALYVLDIAFELSLAEDQPYVVEPNAALAEVKEEPSDDEDKDEDKDEFKPETPADPADPETTPAE